MVTSNQTTAIVSLAPAFPEHNADNGKRAFAGACQSVAGVEATVPTHPANVSGTDAICRPNRNISGCDSSVDMLRGEAKYLKFRFHFVQLSPENMSRIIP